MSCSGTAFVSFGIDRMTSSEKRKTLLPSRARTPTKDRGHFRLIRRKAAYWSFDGRDVSFSIHPVIRLGFFQLLRLVDVILFSNNVTTLYCFGRLWWLNGALFETAPSVRVAKYWRRSIGRNERGRVKLTPIGEKSIAVKNRGCESRKLGCERSRIIREIPQTQVRNDLVWTVWDATPRTSVFLFKTYKTILFVSYNLYIHIKSFSEFTVLSVLCQHDGQTARSLTCPVFSCSPVLLFVLPQTGIGLKIK